MAASEPPLAERPLARLLDAVAAQTPAPGGGSCAAAAGALAAALVEMATSFTLAHDRYSDRHEHMAKIHSRARARRAELLELAEVELQAFEPVLEALRLPADTPERGARISAARSRAAQPPHEVARAAAEIARLASETAQNGNPQLMGDAVVGALLAEAACRAAARLVEINLRELGTDPRLAEVAELVQEAVRAREEVLA